MKSAYVAVSFAHRHDLSDVLDTIEAVLQENKIQRQVFVRTLSF